MMIKKEKKNLDKMKRQFAKELKVMIDNEVLKHKEEKEKEKKVLYKKAKID
jgi:hypothetical protein